MTPNPEKKAYELYTSHGVSGGSALSSREFSEFWASLSGEEKNYWMEQFAKGPTRLTTEFVASVDVVEINENDDRLLARIRTVLGKET